MMLDAVETGHITLATEVVVEMVGDLGVAGGTVVLGLGQGSEGEPDLVEDGAVVAAVHEFLGDGEYPDVLGG